MKRKVFFNASQADNKVLNLSFGGVGGRLVSRRIVKRGEKRGKGWGWGGGERKAVSEKVCMERGTGKDRRVVLQGIIEIRGNDLQKALRHVGRE